MEPERVDELIAGYALDALSADDERELEEHLRRSPEAREQLAGLQEAASALAFGVETPAPPPELRGRVLERARTELPPNVVPFRRRAAVPALAAAAAVAAGVAIGLGVWGAGLSGSLSDERATLDRQERVLALLADPTSARYELEGASGTLVVRPGGEAGLVLSELEPAPEGKTYQAWVIAGERPLPAGLFAGGDDTVVLLTRPVPPGAAVAVTVEQAGGAEAPTETPGIVASTV